MNYFKAISAIDQLKDYVKSQQKENEELHKQLRSYDKDAEIAKRDAEIARLKKYGTFFTPDETKKVDEFWEKHTGNKGHDVHFEFYRYPETDIVEVKCKCGEHLRFFH